MFAAALSFFGLVCSFRHASNLTGFGQLVTDGPKLVKKTMYNHKNYDSYPLTLTAYPQNYSSGLGVCIRLPLKRDMPAPGVVFFARAVEKLAKFAL